MNINVSGGTNAGRRNIRDLPMWFCDCPTVVTHRKSSRNTGITTVIRRTHQGHRYSCPDCGARRPA